MKTTLPNTPSQNVGSRRLLILLLLAAAVAPFAVQKQATARDMIFHPHQGYRVYYQQPTTQRVSLTDQRNAQAWANWLKNLRFTVTISWEWRNPYYVFYVSYSCPRLTWITLTNASNVNAFTQTMTNLNVPTKAVPVNDPPPIVNGPARPKLPFAHLKGTWKQSEYTITIDGRGNWIAMAGGRLLFRGAISQTVAGFTTVVLTAPDNSPRKTLKNGSVKVVNGLTVIDWAGGDRWVRQ